MKARRSSSAVTGLAKRIRGTDESREGATVERWKVIGVSPLLIAEIEGELVLEDGDPDFTIGTALRLVMENGIAIDDQIMVVASGGEWHAFDAVTAIEPSGRRGANVKEWGAKGDAATDDSAAIQECIDALPKGPNGGGRIYFPRGFYLCKETLDLNNLTGITWEGDGGLGLLGLRGGDAPYGASVLLCNGSKGIDVGRTVGFTMRNMAVLAFAGEFTGNLLDFTSPNDEPAVRMTLEQVTLSGGRTPHETALMDLTNAVLGYFRGVVFLGGNSGVLGRREPGHFSTTHLFESCLFEAAATRLTGNAHQAWTFHACAFEQLFAADLPAGAGSYSEFGGCLGQGLSFTGCWFGDSTRSGIHIASAAVNLHVTDCLMNGAHKLIELTAPTVGVIIENNRWENADIGCDIGPELHQGRVMANSPFDVGEVIANAANAHASLIQGGTGGVATLELTP